MTKCDCCAYSEYVKNYHQIYKYNCLQKDEFIKKGMGKLQTNLISKKNLRMMLMIDFSQINIEPRRKRNHH